VTLSLKVRACPVLVFQRPFSRLFKVVQWMGDLTGAPEASRPMAAGTGSTFQRPEQVCIESGWTDVSDNGLFVGLCSHRINFTED